MRSFENDESNYGAEWKDLGKSNFLEKWVNLLNRQAVAQPAIPAPASDNCKVLRTA